MGNYCGPAIRHLQRYAIALASSGLALWGRSLLHPSLGGECPFSLFYLSVLLTAWLAGTGPAILSIGLGTVFAAHFFIPPESSLAIGSLSDQIHLVIYVFVNFVAILLFNRVERQRRLAEKRSAENLLLSHSLRQTDERKDEFLALLAHELRNPLAPIRSGLALLKLKPDSVDVLQRVHGIFHRQTSHLVRITDDLLDISRFCRGKMELQIGLLDLRNAITDAIEMSESLFEEKNHRFQALLPHHPVWIAGDRVRLAQLTANLLGNAAKYTPACGRINLQVEQVGSLITVIVSDNGIGFAPGESERILEPFVQIDPSRTREYGGLGVGLTIVSRLVSMHGGELLAHSRGPGMGSCFTVNLKAATPPVETASGEEPACTNQLEMDNIREKESPPYRVAGQDPVRPHVMIVDDNQDATELLAELFESAGYEASQAYDGMTALQKISQRCPAIVILDIGLPGMDGYEVARRIRRLEFAQQVRLIALTGWGGSTDRESGRQAGFDMHLVKPVSFGELQEHVESLLNGQFAGLSVSSFE